MPISIVVPAYNEEVTIINTVQSLLSLDYKTYEIIIVNDGSTDHTLDTLIEKFKLKMIHRPLRKELKCQNQIAVYENDMGDKVSITLVNKENGGKADSINMGINVSKYPYFVCMDADSLLQTDSLKNSCICTGKSRCIRV